MKNRVFPALGPVLALGVLFCQVAPAQTVRFQTNLGDIEVTLLPESAPQTVQNFLRYVNRGAYNNSFFHRSVPGFIIQGGGYQFVNNAPVPIPSDPPVRNEYRVSNTRGTLAMAKLGSDPNSATNQWFFNLGNNASNLNSQNGGFTVFGRVANAAGLAVMDRIAAVPVYNAGSPFDQLPLQNVSSSSSAITAANLIIVNSISVVEPTPSISQNGVVAATNFGGYAAATVGSYIEIYGTNLSGTSREWSGNDFTQGFAPTALEGVTVTVDGKPAYVSYVSPTQVNAQVPGGVASSGTVPVVVSYGGRSSAPVTLTMQTRAGGLLAPASFKVNGKQYAAAIHQTSGAFVSNGSVPNVPSAPVVPGEMLVFYGMGFGPVTSGDVAGQIAAGAAPLTTPVQFLFGDVAAQVQYAGVAPGFVGLYQFNVIVPASLPNGDVSLRVLVGGEPIGQTLFLPVQNPGS